MGSLVLLGVFLVALSGVAIASKSEGEPDSCVAFKGTQRSAVAGRAELEAHRRNTELDLVRLEGMDPGAIHVFWLRPEHKGGFWVGGGIKADRQGSFRGSADIVGASALARRHVKRTRSVLVTAITKRGLRRIVKRYRPSRWTKSGHAIGRVVATGELSPPKTQGFWPCHRP